MTCPAPGPDDLPHRLPCREEVYSIAADHHADCTGPRLETFEVDGPHRSRWRTTRCLDCSASSTTAVVPAEPLVPGTEEYAQAWRLEPSRIRRQLTTDEELLDPLRNPMHPRAEPDAPVFTGSITPADRRAHWPHFPGDEVRKRT